MFTKIACVEFTELMRDGRFRVAAAIVFLLLSSALAAGWNHFRQVREQRQIAQQGVREAWLNQGNKNPHSAAHYGTYAFRPATPLSLVDAGLDAYVGTAIYLEAHKQNESAFAPAQDRSALQRFGELTAATVLQLVLPLIVIFFTFGSFAGEREAGTLRQLLGLGIRARNLIFGKALGITAAFALLLGPATVIGGAALWFSNADETVGLSLSRMFWMDVGYLLYFTGILGVSLAVSAHARSARPALVALLGFWVVNILIAPRIGSDVSRQISPVPPSAEFWTAVENEIRNGMDGHNPQDRRVQALQQQTLKQYGVDRVEDLPINFQGLALQTSEEYSNQVFDLHFSRLWDVYDRQARIQQIGGIVAPLLAIRSLSMGMAGTDFAHYRRFAVAAESYRRLMVKTLNDDLMRNAKRRDYVADRAVWERIPDFHYNPPDTRWVVRNQAISLAVLCLWGIVGMGLAIIAASRMSVF
jgi:ABC-2 type transport system permease protein